MDAFEWRRWATATNPLEHDESPQMSDTLRDKFSRIGPNVSPEHRAILEAALARVFSRSFNEALSSMPNVGLDSDFDRDRG